MLKLRALPADKTMGWTMVDGWIFLYAVPAATGVLAFLKVVSNQVKAIESAVRVRGEEREIAAARATAAADESGR